MFIFLKLIARFGKNYQEKKEASLKLFILKEEIEKMSKNRIKILPENVVNKIAAGEVVQRPESVVKELLENSIDASSQCIELYVKHAGKSLIHVIDDGIGMNEADAVLCVQKHATSKITTYQDL